MPAVEFKESELELQFVIRGERRSFLRLIIPTKRNGVRVFVEAPLRPDAPGKQWLETYKKLYEEIVHLHRSQRR